MEARTSFEGVEAGKLQLVRGGPFRVCIDSLSMGGRPSELPFQITGEQGRTQISAHAKETCGSVAGALTSGGAGTVLITTDDLDAIKATRADKQGRFQIVGLNDGSYRLFAFTSLGDVPFRDVSYLRTVKDKSIGITISGGNGLNQISLEAVQ